MQIVYNEFQIVFQTRAYTGLVEAYLLDIYVFVIQDTQDLGVMQVIYRYLNRAKGKVWIQFKD